MLLYYQLGEAVQELRGGTIRERHRARQAPAIALERAGL